MPCPTNPPPLLLLPLLFFYRNHVACIKDKQGSYYRSQYRQRYYNTLKRSFHTTNIHKVVERYDNSPWVRQIYYFDAKKSIRMYFLLTFITMPIFTLQQIYLTTDTKLNHKIHTMSKKYQRQRLHLHSDIRKKAEAKSLPHR